MISRGVSWTAVPHSSLSRNEGVRGSSPRVGFLESPVNRPFCSVGAAAPNSRGQHMGQQDVSVGPPMRRAAEHWKLGCYREGGGCIQRREAARKTWCRTRFSSPRRLSLIR